MFNNLQQQNGNQTSFLSSMQGLASVVAVMVTVICAPLLYETGVPYLEAMIERTYGSGWIPFISGLYWLLCFPLVFYLSRAFLVTSLMTAAMAFAIRFV